MQIVSYIKSITGLTEAQLFGVTPPLVKIVSDAAGNITLPVWNVPGVAQPTAAQVAAALVAPEPSPTPAALLAYASQKAAALLANGQTFNVAAAGAGAVDVLCDGTSPTIGVLAAFDAFGQANPAGSKTWRDNNGVSTVLTGAECVSLATQACTWADDIYSALATLDAQITATPPTITVTAQIDAFAWPTA